MILSTETRQSLSEHFNFY